MTTCSTCGQPLCSCTDHDWKGGWRDIASAPKDGRDVLLFYPLEGLNHDVHPQVIIGCWSEARLNPRLSAWVFQARAFRSYSDHYQPTHWMPLPSAPDPAVLTYDGSPLAGDTALSGNTSAPAALSGEGV